jgi:hypothetical protein
MAPAVAPSAVSSGRPALSSEWIGMNLLMVRPDLAIVDDAQRDLALALQRRGVEVIGHTLRHARALGGGFHCMTLDLRRGPLNTPTATSPAAAPPFSPRETVMIHRPDQPDPDRSQPIPSGTLAARYRQLRGDPGARQVLQARSRVVDALRRALHDTGHVEVDTPLPQRARPAAGRSFRTETHSLDPHTYLRSSPLHLRAILTTGLERVFEIGRSFRDEPVDATHSPEYSLVELYQVSADYHRLRGTARDLVLAAARAATGSTTIRTRAGHPIDLAGRAVPHRTRHRPAAPDRPRNQRRRATRARAPPSDRSPHGCRRPGASAGALRPARGAGHRRGEQIDLTTTRARYVVKVFATGRAPEIAARTAGLIVAAHSRCPAPAAASRPHRPPHPPVPGRPRRQAPSGAGDGPSRAAAPTS